MAEGAQMRVLYMAAPVGTGTAVRGNICRAKRWLKWLYTAFPEDVVIAPWLTDATVIYLMADDDIGREKILRRCEAVAALCDAVLLVGGKVTEGMRREADACLVVRDMTRLGDEPPEGKVQ